MKRYVDPPPPPDWWRPVSWWCPKCEGSRSTPRWAGVGWTMVTCGAVGDIFRCGTVCIPVFEPLTPPEVVDWEEAEVVVGFFTATTFMATGDAVMDADGTVIAARSLHAVGRLADDARTYDIGIVADGDVAR